MIREELIPSLVLQVTREQRGLMERRLARFDVTLQQASVLLRLQGGGSSPDEASARLRARREARSPHELAAALSTDNAGMTRLLDRLEAKGLVARGSHPTDRRAITVELTGAGAALAPRLGPVIGSVSRDMLAGLTAEESASLGSLLGRLLDNLRHVAGEEEARTADPVAREGLR